MLLKIATTVHHIWTICQSRHLPPSAIWRFSLFIAFPYTSLGRSWFVWATVAATAKRAMARNDRRDSTIQYSSYFDVCYTCIWLPIRYAAEVPCLLCAMKRGGGEPPCFWSMMTFEFLHIVDRARALASCTHMYMYMHISLAGHTPNREERGCGPRDYLHVPWTVSCMHTEAEKGLLPSLKSSALN